MKVCPTPPISHTSTLSFCCPLLSPSPPSSYEFVGFAVVLGLVTYIMLRLYLPTATKIKGLVSDTAGTLVGLTTESLEGLDVIQAFQHEDYFVKVSSLLLLSLQLEFVCLPLGLYGLHIAMFPRVCMHSKCLE